jgi:hypothetical protein
MVDIAKLERTNDSPTPPRAGSGRLSGCEKCQPSTIRPSSTTSAAARQRRLRKRQTSGIVVVRVEVSLAITETLIDLGWVGEQESDDRAQVGAGITALLADLAADHSRKKP